MTYEKNKVDELYSEIIVLQNKAKNLYSEVKSIQNEINTLYDKAEHALNQKSVDKWVCINKPNAKMNEREAMFNAEMDESEAMINTKMNESEAMINEAKAFHNEANARLYKAELIALLYCNCI
jgi:hypothetical protein